MSLRSFSRIFIWELEEYWRCPVLEIVLSTAILSALSFTPPVAPFENRYVIFSSILNRGYSIFMLFFIVGAIVSRSFAGSINSREMVVLLSYPLKRWIVFLSKFTVSLLTLFVLFGAPVILNVVLLDLSPFEPAIYISILVLFVRLTFLCIVTVAISLVTKQEIASILGSVLLFFGLEFATAQLGSPYLCLSSTGGNNVIIDYLTAFFHSTTSNYTSQDFLVAFTFPSLASLLLLTLGLIYFQWIMQLD